MAERLRGKTCIITGTGGSMGRATALLFAREGALVVGCDVAVEAAQETLELVKAAGGEMVSLQPCILSDPADCARLADFRRACSAASTRCSTSPADRISGCSRTSPTRTGTPRGRMRST